MEQAIKAAYFHWYSHWCRKVNTFVKVQQRIYQTYSIPSHHQTLLSVFLDGWWHQHCTNCLIKHILQAFLGKGRTLQVLYSPNFLLHLCALWISNWCHSFFAQLFNRISILANIEFGPN